MQKTSEYVVPIHDDITKPFITQRQNGIPTKAELQVLNRLAIPMRHTSRIWTA